MKNVFRLLFVVGLLSGCVNSYAQFVWSGSSLVNGSVNDANNWQPHSPATPVGDGSEDLVFGTLTGSQANVLVPTASYNNITVTGTGSTYLLSGLSGLQTVGINGTIEVDPGSTATFDNTLVVNLSAGYHTVNVDVAGGLQISSAITGAGGLHLTNQGTVVLTGASNYSGGTILDGGTLVVSGSIDHPAAELVVANTSGSTANLTISAGGSVTDSQGRIGLSDPTTSGTVTVSGAGASWSNSVYLYVGELGNATLNVTTGGTVSSVSTSIGNNAGGHGTVTVSGAGSSLVNSDTLYVGSAGSGSLYADSGAQITDVTGSIANNPGGSGYVSIDGAGTNWNNSGDLHVGDSAMANFFISDGAQVTSNNGYLGTQSAGAGYAYIDGPGSSWAVASTAYIGYQGTGALLVSDSGNFTVGNGAGTIYLGVLAGSSGQLILGDEENGGGTINAAEITTGAGAGALIFATNNSAGDPYYLTRDGTANGTPVEITGPTLVQVESGYVVLAGNNTYSGGTGILDGTLVAASNNALGTGPVTFYSGSATLNVASGVTVANPLVFTAGGTLAGNGTFSSAVTLGSGTILSPGNSVGTLTFSSGLTLGGGSTLVFQVQTAGGTAGTGYDLVNVSGGPLTITALSSNPVTIELQSLDALGDLGNVADFSSSSSYAWTLLTAPAGSISGFSPANFTIDGTLFSNNLGIGSFFLTQSGNQIELNFTPVPEPSTYALLVAGLGTVGLAVWRRRALRG